MHEWDGEPPTRAVVAEAIRSRLQGMAWPDAPLDLGGCRWRPDLVGGDHVVHVACGPSVPNAYLKRIEAAVASGLKVSVAVLAPPGLSDIRRLQASRVRILAVNERLEISEFSSVADWISLGRIALDSEALQVLGADLLAVSESSDKAFVRGRAFEELLCLLFSQVSWLRVTHHAYRNSSEEIDLVLQVVGVGSAASLAGGPIAVATAKNEVSPAGSSVVKYLKGQMSNRRGRCKMGFLCSMQGISRDAHGEINRGSETERLIVPLDRAAIERLLSSGSRLEERLEEYVYAAVAA